MKIKDALRLFLPPVYYKIKETIKGEPEKIDSLLPQIQHKSDKIVVIGNGPSLNKSIELYKNEILKHDRICVNFFGSSKLYEELKPNIYVFADPAWFNVPEHLSESVNQLLNNIIIKTTWTLQIIIPFGAKGTPMEAKLLKNQNIRIDYYFNGTQDIGKLSKFEAWDKNLIAPPAQTVLNTCVYFSLYWNYPETYLIGADSSFLEDIFVDQQTNEVFTVDKHFYQNREVYSDRTLFNKENRRSIDTDLATELRCQMNVFLNYKELALYAEYKGLKVYNASEYSLIDSFKRKKLR